MKSDHDNLLESYGRLAAYYDTDNPPVWQEIRELVADIQPGSTVLDIGCGTGRVRQVLPEQIFYTGLDNSEPLLEIAQGHYPRDKFILADARQLPLPDKSFDAVLLIAIVHHFLKKEDRLTVLKEAKRVLKSEGGLYLSVWNLNRLKFWKNWLASRSFSEGWRGWRRVVISNRHDPSIKRHYHVYTQRQLRSELETIGLKIERLGLAGQNIVAKARG